MQADGGTFSVPSALPSSSPAPPNPLILPSEPTSTLILAEDLRMFHSHLKCSGLLFQAPSVLLMYRHAMNASQSSRTPRDLLVKLRLKAFSDRVLSEPPFSSGFCVWGAGRDGKGFIKVRFRDRFLEAGSYRQLLTRTSPLPSPPPQPPRPSSRFHPLYCPSFVLLSTWTKKRSRPAFTSTVI